MTLAKWQGAAVERAMKQLFGTDGIRGTADEFPLNAPTMQAAGASLARIFSERLGRKPRLITGRDTRESGGRIEASFHQGGKRGGADIVTAGVMTTPGVAYLTKAFEFDAGIVISASHNPYHDNGIKIFLPSGMKVDEVTERAIESDIYSSKFRVSDAIPDEPRPDAIYRLAYSMHLSTIASRIAPNKLKVIVDCANGAASKIAKQVLKRSCATLITINDTPDGRNINENCGSLHLKTLKDRVLSEQADMGVALDGDADRALFIDENGVEVDGDATLWIMANYLKENGKLENATVVATVMSNIGLELALAAKKIKLLRTQVGDKYVLESLIETGSEIGGEQSGHIIFPNESLVGDGMMTSLAVIRAIVEGGVKLSQAVSGFVKYPQILLNVKVSEKQAFDSVPAISAAARAIERELEGEGRLLLRYSGTENLARVMIEGKEQSVIESQARRLAGVIELALG
jgi:phosphoglucosamine mutase